MEIFDFYRKDRWPHVFCPGCGIGTVMNCFYRAFNDLSLSLEKTIFVGGIGCSSRIPLYINSDALHTTHGRAIAFATGLKLANPELKVVVFTGDDELRALGGNHFINGFRRNVDMTVMSTFRRQPLMKWFPPIAPRSPSPVNTTTLRSGLESLSPVANAIALPWVVWSASELMYSGILEEHPMPPTKAVLSRGRSSSLKAL